MLKEILANFESGVQLPEWLKQYPELAQKAFVKREKQERFADELIKYLKEQDVIWHRGKTEAITMTDGHILLFQQHPSRAASRYRGGLVFNYVLIVFEIGDEIFELRNTCDEASYDSMSYRIPAMDLYDFAMTGARRKPKMVHVCGLAGFGGSVNDVCPACEASR